MVLGWRLSRSQTQTNRKQNYIIRVWTGSWCPMITNWKVPSKRVGKIKIVGSSALPSRTDIRYPLKDFPQIANVDHGSIPDGADLTAVANRSGDLTLRIYFTRDGKLVEIWWSQKGGWQSWIMHDAAALGVSAVSYSDNIYVFFQDKTEYLSALSLNRFVNKWQFTAII